MAAHSWNHIQSKKKWKHTTFLVIHAEWSLLKCPQGEVSLFLCVYEAVSQHLDTAVDWWKVLRGSFIFKSYYTHTIWFGIYLVVHAWTLDVCPHVCVSLSLQSGLFCQQTGDTFPPLSPQTIAKRTKEFLFVCILCHAVLELFPVTWVHHTPSRTLYRHKSKSFH